MASIGRLRVVPGSLSEALGVSLAALAEQVPAELVIVDVGADRGRTTCYLAFGARNGLGAHVYGTDPSWGPRGRQIAMLSVRQQGLRDQVTLLDAPTVPVDWPGPKIGLLYVAGDRFDAKTAVAAWRPHIAEGALLAYADNDRIALERFEAPPKAQEPKPSEPEPKQEAPSEEPSPSAKSEATEPTVSEPEPVIEHGTVEVLPAEAPETVSGKAEGSYQAAAKAEPKDDLDSLTVARLISLAKKEGAEVEKGSRKREIIAAIRAHRDEQASSQ